MHYEMSICLHMPRHDLTQGTHFEAIDQKLRKKKQKNTDSISSHLYHH